MQSKHSKGQPPPMMAKNSTPVEAAVDLSGADYEARKQALAYTLDKIEKDFGKGSIMRLGERPNVNIDVIPTGALSLDLALGVGGIPRGRIVEIYGPESSGKTTLTLNLIAQAQKKRRHCRLCGC